MTYQRPQTDRYNYPEAYLRARIVGMLGGRAAEEVVYGTRTTGADSDLFRPRSWPQHGDALGHGRAHRHGGTRAARQRYLGGGGGFAGAWPFSEKMARLVNAEVQRIIHESHAEAIRMLRQHRGALDALVKALLGRETLGELEILETTGLPPPPAL